MGVLAAWRLRDRLAGRYAAAIGVLLGLGSAWLWDLSLPDGGGNLGLFSSFCLSALLGYTFRYLWNNQLFSAMPECLPDKPLWPAALLFFTALVASLTFVTRHTDLSTYGWYYVGYGVVALTGFYIRKLFEQRGFSQRQVCDILFVVLAGSVPASVLFLSAFANLLPSSNPGAEIIAVTALAATSLLGFILWTVFQANRQEQGLLEAVGHLPARLRQVFLIGPSQSGKTVVLSCLYLMGESDEGRRHVACLLHGKDEAKSFFRREALKLIETTPKFPDHTPAGLLPVNIEFITKGATRGFRRFFNPLWPQLQRTILKTPEYAGDTLFPSKGDAPDEIDDDALKSWTSGNLIETKLSAMPKLKEELAASDGLILLLDLDWPAKKSEAYQMLYDSLLQRLRVGSVNRPLLLLLTKFDHRFRNLANNPRPIAEKEAEAEAVKRFHYIESQTLYWPRHFHATYVLIDEIQQGGKQTVRPRQDFDPSLEALGFWGVLQWARDI